MCTKGNSIINNGRDHVVLGYMVRLWRDAHAHVSWLLGHTDRPLLKLTQQTYWCKIVILINSSNQLQQPAICFIRNKGIGCVRLNCAGLIIHLCLFQFPWVKKNITTMTLHKPINVEHTNYLFLHSSVRGRGRELQKNNEYPFGQLSRVELSGVIHN